jgi:glycosyltransferase involved in cell wall biosynthesis
MPACELRKPIGWVNVPGALSYQTRLRIVQSGVDSLSSGSGHVSVDTPSQPIRITVVTPSWNQGPFLRRCLESIRPVSGVRLEHIVLDNCSSDETGRILAEFEARDDGVSRRFIVEKDEGQTRAINEGFSLATGDVICWLNTDEWYADDTLAKVAGHFRASPETDFLYGNCTFVDSDGKVVRARRSLGFDPAMLLYYGCYISSAAAFVRRRVIDDGELLDPEFRVAMDYEWYNRLAARGYRFAHIPDVLAYFTWHQNNISMRQRERSFEERLMVQRRFGSLSIPEAGRPAAARMLRTLWKARRRLRALSTAAAQDSHGPRGVAVKRP